MDDAQASWEGIAADILSETGCDAPPVDAFELADCLGVEVRASGTGRAYRRGSAVYVPVRARRERQHGTLAHELGHVCLEQAGEPDSEDGARYLSGALMLPRRAFERDLAETSWDLRSLRARHTNASAEMIARRIVNLNDAVATIFDQGKVRTRIVSPWLPERYARITRFERELADQVLSTGEAVRGDELVWAFPIFSGFWRRVVLVAEAEQLALRF